MIATVKSIIQKRDLKRNPTDSLWKYLEVVQKGGINDNGQLFYKEIILDYELGLASIEDGQSKYLPSILSPSEYDVLQSTWSKRMRILN